MQTHVLPQSAVSRKTILAAPPRRIDSCTQPVPSSPGSENLFSRIIDSLDESLLMHIFIEKVGPWLDCLSGSNKPVGQPIGTRTKLSFLIIDSSQRTCHSTPSITQCYTLQLWHAAQAILRLLRLVYTARRHVVICSPNLGIQTRSYLSQQLSYSALVRP
jgi:hypothetical protein